MTHLKRLMSRETFFKQGQMLQTNRSEVKEKETERWMVLWDINKRQTVETEQSGGRVMERSASVHPVSDRAIGRQTDSNHYCLRSKQAHTQTILIRLSVYTPSDKTGGERSSKTRLRDKMRERNSM